MEIFVGYTVQLSVEDIECLLHYAGGFPVDRQRSNREALAALFEQEGRQVVTLAWEALAEERVSLAEAKGGER